MTAKLTAQYEAIRAVNTAKHKAAGKTHRVQLDTFGPRGAYIRTVVYYTAFQPDEAWLAKAALNSGSKSIWASVESAKIEAL